MVFKGLEVHKWYIISPIGFEISALHLILLDHVLFVLFYFQMANSLTTTAKPRRQTRWPPASNCRWPNTPTKTKNLFCHFKLNVGEKKVTLNISKDLTMVTFPVWYKVLQKIIQVILFSKIFLSEKHVLKYGAKVNDYSIHVSAELS